MALEWQIGNIPFLIPQFHSKESTSSLFTHLIIPHLERQLTPLFYQLYQIFISNLKDEVKYVYTQQFIEILKAKNTPLTSKDIERLEEIGNKLVRQKNPKPHQLLFPFMLFFGSIANIHLNQAAYELFNALQFTSLKKHSAKALCQGIVSNGVQIFIKICKDPMFTFKDKCELCEILITEIKKLSSSHAIYYIGMISKEIEMICDGGYSFVSKEWMVDILYQLEQTKAAQKILHLNDNSKTSTKNESTSSQPSKNQEGFESKGDLMDLVKMLLDSPTEDFFYQISNIVHQPKTMSFFENNVETVWHMILQPALQLAEDKPFIQTHTLFIACLETLARGMPNKEVFLHFLHLLDQAIEKVPEKQSLPKQFKNTLSCTLSQIFKSLVEFNEDVLLAAIAHRFHFQGIHIQSHTEVILEGMNKSLDHEPPVEIHLKLVLELLNDSALKESWKKSSRKLLSSIYKKLISTLIVSHFDQAFAILEKYLTFTKNIDVSLLAKVLEICGENYKYNEFITLSKISSRQSYTLQRVWKNTFRHLFLNESNQELNERQLSTLSQLGKLAIFYTLLKKTELVSSLFQVLTYVKTHSLQFYPTIEFGLMLMEVCPVEESLWENFFELLKFCSSYPFKEKGWKLLSSSLHISESTKAPHLLFLLESLKKSQSTLFLDLLSSVNTHPLFRIALPNRVEAYALLFEGLAAGWPKWGNPKKLKTLHALHSKLSKDTSIDTKTWKWQRLEIAYVNCLTSSPKPIEGTEAFFLLIELMKKHFTEFKQEWTEELRTTFKKIVVHSSVSRDQLHQFIYILNQFPDHEIGCFLLKLFMPNRSDKESIGICTLLDNLIKHSRELKPLEFSQFKHFCRSLKVEKLFNEMIVFQDLELNIWVMDCLEFPFIQQFISPEIKFNLKIRGYLNISQSVAVSNRFNETILNDILLFMVELKKTNHKSEIQELALFNLHSIICGYVMHEENIQVFTRFFNTVNSLLGMSKINPTLSKKYNTNVQDLDDFFYQFSYVLLEDYYNIPLGEKYAPFIQAMGDVFKTGLKNPSNFKPQFFKFAFYLCFIIEELAQLDEVIETNRSIIDNLKQLKKEILFVLIKATSQNKQYSYFKILIEYYVKIECKSTKPAITPLQGTHHDLISALTSLINYENSLQKTEKCQVTFKLTMKLLDYYFNDLLNSFTFFVRFLELLSKYVVNIESIHQADYFTHVALLNLNIHQACKLTHGSGGRHTLLMQNSAIENFKNYIQMFKQNLITNQDQLLIINFPTFVSHHALILQKKFEVYENSLPHYLMLCAMALPKYATDENTFKKFSNCFIKTLFALSPTPIKFKEVRTGLFMQWIEILLRFGQRSSINEIVRKVVETYLIKGIKIGLIAPPLIE